MTRLPAMRWTALWLGAGLLASVASVAIAAPDDGQPQGAIIEPLPLPGAAAVPDTAPAANPESPAPVTPKARPVTAAISDTAAPHTNTNNATVPAGALDITADGTLEWLRDQQMYVARVNASAKRNDTTVNADVLTARYRVPAGKKDGIEIHQVTADGNVHMFAPNADAVGDHGVYDLDKHVVVLTGKDLKLTTTDEVVTAKDSLEYFEDTATGVARGNAVAVRDGDTLTADTIAAKFSQNNKSDAGTGGQTKPKAPEAVAPNKTAAGAAADAATATKKQSLEQLDAKGHVVLVTVTDVVTGDEGVYNPNSQQATVTGNVKVTRGENQLNGARAEVDMATGISRVFSAPGTRVRGLFVPQKKDKTADKTADAAANGATP